MPLSEAEVLDRHQQALGEAHAACQRLGASADPDRIMLRQGQYAALQKALKHLEGSCRQMAHFRSDARWVRLDTLYARLIHASQAKFVGQDWAWFSKIMPVFERGLRSMNDLKDMRTGRLTSQPILPANPSSWLVFPDYRPPGPQIIRH